MGEAAEVLMDETSVCEVCGSKSTYRNLQGLAFWLGDEYIELTLPLEGAYCDTCQEALLTPEQAEQLDRKLRSSQKWLAGRAEWEERQRERESRTIRMPGIPKPIILTPHVLERWQERYSSRKVSNPKQYLQSRIPFCTVGQGRGNSFSRLKRHGEYSIYLYDVATDIILVLSPKPNVLVARTIYKGSDCRWKKKTKWTKFKDFEWWVV